MSLLTQAYLLERYGPRLSMDELAVVLHLNVKTLRNHASAGTLKVRTYLDAGGRFADYTVPQSPLCSAIRRETPGLDTLRLSRVCTLPTVGLEQREPARGSRARAWRGSRQRVKRWMNEQY